MRWPGPGLITTMMMVWFMVRARSAVAMVSFSIRTRIVVFRAALVAILICLEVLGRFMWARAKMYLEADRYLTPSITTYIKVGLLSGILQPVKLIEKVGKF